MYSRRSWGGSVDPFILTKFDKAASDEEVDSLVSLIIFEWKDQAFLGRTTASGDMKVWDTEPSANASEAHMRL